MKNASTSLGGTLVLILISATISVIITVIAGIVTGEWMYYVAAFLFATSGATGIFVVRSLSAKMKR